MAARGLVGTDQACPLWWKEELHGVCVVSAGLKSAARYTGWDERAHTKPHVREGKQINKLLTLYLLIFLDTRQRLKWIVKWTCLFSAFFVLPIRLIACLRLKNISPWTLSLSSKSIITCLWSPDCNHRTGTVHYPDLCQGLWASDLSRAESVMTEDGVGTT